MNINDYIDFESIVNDAEISVDDEYGNELDYELCDELCSVEDTESGQVVIIALGTSNGCHGNDPSYEGHIVTITLDENLQEIDRNEEII
jgi:hypothetical protein